MSDQFDKDDIVERAVEALHRERVPHGPSQDVRMRTLGALKEKEHAASGVASREDLHERSNLVTRILTMTFAQRIAAVVMVTIGGLTLWFMFALFGGFASVSYAQVAQQIRDAQTMTFKMTTTSPQIAKPIETKLYAKEPGLMRNEGPAGVVTISRREGDMLRMLQTEPTGRTARLIESKITNAAAAQQPDFVESFRKLADQKGEPLDERQVGDVKAKGFKVIVEGQSISLWADPKTARPLLVEMDVPAAGEGSKVVLSEIAFDVPLDEKLFSLDVPEGYKLEQNKLTVTLDLEANVTNLLRAYTKMTNGAFPEKLTDWAEYGKVMAASKQKADDATLQALSGAGAITAILSTSKVGEDFDYLGKGAKLGEVDRIVFWHRDKTKGTYRAVFADLSVKDVAADQVLKVR